MGTKGSGSRGLLLRDGDGKGGKGKIREGKKRKEGEERERWNGMEWRGGACSINKKIVSAPLNFIDLILGLGSFYCVYD